MAQRNGIILPTALFIIALLSMLAGLGTYYAVRVNIRTQIRVQNEQLQQELLNQVIAGNGIKTIESDNIISYEHSIKNGKFLLGTVKLSQSPSDLGILNFDPLLKWLNLCPLKKAPPYSSSMGFVLTTGSIVSPLLCAKLPSVNEPIISLEGNFETIGDLTLDRSLFASGYVALAGSLTTTNDLTIMAGGDIIINNINVGAPNPLTLTLHSRTGMVSVVSLSPSIHLICSGHSTICPPSIGIAPPEPPLLPTKSSQVIGIM